MTWKEAIRKVLQEEGGPLHYTDITSRIFENGYRKKEECGATPDQTVCAQLATKILIEGLEPRQNRKAGNDFGFEFIQAQDSEMEENKMRLDIMKKLLK